MAPRRAAIAALALATSCLLLVTAGAAPTKDGFLVPLASNDAWDYYEFNVSNKMATTSLTPFNSSRGATDATAAGTTFTHMAQLINDKGEVVGIYQNTRAIVGDNVNMPGLKGTRVFHNLITAMAEFGKPETGYFDDALAVTVVMKRVANQKGGADYADNDGVITGGTGRFLGATGATYLKPQVLDKRSGIIAQGTMLFKVWVPRNLPTPKGPISGRRRAL